MPQPIVASYCTTFLKPEMLHIYRQVTALRRYATVVITKERQGMERYPFDPVRVLARPRSNFVRRFHLKYIRKAPPIFYRGEFQVLQRTLAAARADLLHVYFGHTGVHLLPFLRAWDGPALVSFHGADVMPRERDPTYLGRLTELLRYIPLVLVRSHSLRDRVIELGCPEEKIRLNRTGIPLGDYPFHPRSAPADGAWHFVQACRLIPKKGLRTALRAFAKLRRKWPLARFTIAGEGPMRDEILTLARELGSAEAVRLSGFLDQTELRALYRSAHIFLHPSEMTSDQNQEGVPNSMLEAMATGLPVVATLHGGIPEAVRQEVDGLLVPERDVEALSEALNRLTQPDFWQRTGISASDRVREEFEQGRQVARLEDCYDEVRNQARTFAGSEKAPDSGT